MLKSGLYEKRHPRFNALHCQDLSNDDKIKLLSTFRDIGFDPDGTAGADPHGGYAREIRETAMRVGGRTPEKAIDSMIALRKKYGSDA